MGKLRIFYIVSLAILGVLIIFAVLRPMTAGKKYSEVQQEQLLQTENGCAIRFVITNHEGEDKAYTVKVSFGSYQFSQDVLIPDGNTFTYVHNLNPEQVTVGDIHFVIYKEGETAPFEQLTYHLKQAESNEP